MNVKIVAVSGGHYTIVDEEDFAWVNKIRWHATDSLYVQTNVRIRPGRIGAFKCKKMHRLLMGEPKGLFVDHINGDVLDNRKSNLRICKSIENSRNSKISKANTSGFKGVVWHKASNSWIAQIGIDINSKRKMVHLGCFPLKEDAARAYDKAAREHYGEFARPNFPEEI